MLPVARISHQTPERLRIKIPAHRGDFDFFARVENIFQQFERGGEVKTNANTGSLLLVGSDLKIESVADVAKKESLFVLERGSGALVPLSQRIAAPMNNARGSIERFTRGEIDLAGVALLALLAMGIYQIIKGNFRSPPWYTAFWYALGIFTKSLVEEGE